MMIALRWGILASTTTCLDWLWMLMRARMRLRTGRRHPTGATRLMRLLLLLLLLGVLLRVHWLLRLVMLMLLMLMLVRGRVWRHLLHRRMRIRRQQLLL